MMLLTNRQNNIQILSMTKMTILSRIKKKWQINSMIFFTSIHENLNSSKNRQPPDLAKLKVFVESKIPGDIVFNIPHVTCSFIQNQLQNLKVSKATGIDEDSGRYLKLSVSVISEPSYQNPESQHRHRYISRCSLKKQK